MIHVPEYAVLVCHQYTILGLSLPKYLAGQKTHIEKFVFKGQRDVVEQIIMSTIVFVIATVHQQYSNNVCD